MRSVWRTILLAAAAAPLAGCLTYGSIQNRGTVINEGVGDMQNRGTLLNLVRASRSEPLYFLSINQIQAQSSAQLQLGLPQVVARGLLPASAAIPKGTLIFGNNNTNIAQTNTNTNFQVGVYNSKDFYAGLLTPLGLDEVDLLLHQGFSRELVFYLVIDKVKVTPQPNGESYILFNDPSDPANWAAFKALVQDAMQFGITTEVPLKDEGDGPTQVKAQAGSGSGGATLGNAGAIQFMLTAQESALQGAPLFRAGAGHGRRQAAVRQARHQAPLLRRQARGGGQHHLRGPQWPGTEDRGHSPLDLRNLRLPRPDHARPARADAVSAAGRKGPLGAPADRERRRAVGERLFHFGVLCGEKLLRAPGGR